MNLFENNGATFSTCRNYRFLLWRIWDETKPLVMFIGLNPSTANEGSEDPTIRRVKSIASNLRYGGFYMMNLFPLVSTDPARLSEFYHTPFHEIEEKANYEHLKFHASQCKDIVFAWGNFKIAESKSKEVIEMFPGAYALHINNNGSPKHPLYCKSDSQLIPFNQ